MPLAPRAAAWLLLPLLAACATAALPEPDARLSAMVARLPAQLADFALEDSAASPDNPATWTLRYGHAPSGTVALVVLNASDDVPDGPGSPVVQAAVNTVSLALQAHQGGWGLTRLPDFNAGATGQPPEIRCSDLQVRQPEGAVRRLLVCASGIRGSIATISVIAQHPADAADIARLFMTNFALQAVHALRGEATPGAPAVSQVRGPVFRL